VGIIQQLSQANGNGVLPEMIVVGIENTNRFRDLVPTAPPMTTIEKANPVVRFLSGELMPYIEKNLPAAPYRVLAGHSLGGLTAVYLLSNFPELFNAYIAIDPSMWFNNEKFLNNAITQLKQKKLNGKRLFIGVANTMPKGMTLEKVKADKTPATQHIRSIVRLNEFLETNQSGLVSSYQFYEKENHNTVPLLSLYDGLKFIFNYYQMDLTEKDFLDSSAQIAVQLKKHYAIVSNQLGYQVSAPQSLINYLANDALGKKQYNRAGALFTLNIESYPDSSNVYDSYADFLIVKKDTVNAIAYYKKALSLKSDPLTLNKLNRLTNQAFYNPSADELKIYEGVYTLENYKIDVVIYLRNGKLWSKVPGQPDDEFIPLSKDVFAIKGKQGYSIKFNLKDGKPTEFIADQPNGVFRGEIKR